MHPIHITPDFARTMNELDGEAGDTWLAALPALIDTYARRWSLTILPPFSNLSYNYATPAIRAGGSPVVLKAGLPNPGFTREVEALRIYDGRGIARLLEDDVEHGVMLLERLLPGTMLDRVAREDDQAATIPSGIPVDVSLEFESP